MPLNNGCRFDQHHGVQDLRPNPVTPHPEEPVCAEQPRATWSLPPQDSYLLSQGDELKLQGGAAANTEREQGNEGGKNYDHAHDGMAVTQISLAFLGLSEFCASTSASSIAVQSANLGLGYLIQYGSQIFKMNIIMCGITILAVVSSLMYLAISWLEAAVMRRR
jgi:hypothetical protein